MPTVLRQGLFASKLVLIECRDPITALKGISSPSRPRQHITVLQFIDTIAGALERAAQSSSSMQSSAGDDILSSCDAAQRSGDAQSSINMQHQPAGGHPVSKSAASDSVLSDMAAFAAQTCPSDPAVFQAANAIAIQVSFS